MLLGVVQYNIPCNPEFQRIIWVLLYLAFGATAFALLYPLLLYNDLPFPEVEHLVLSKLHGDSDPETFPDWFIKLHKTHVSSLEHIY